MKQTNIELKCLKKYNNIQDFIKYIEEDLQIINWGIYDLTIEERLLRVRNNKYFIKLKEIARKNNINADETEIISWLDTSNFLYYVFNSPSIFGDFDEDITILQELNIPLTNKRADYVLCCRNKILILEFSFNKWKKEYHYENKLTQVIGYKELLANLLPKHIIIGTYTIILNAEYESYGYDYLQANSKYLNERCFSNLDSQIELGTYIKHFFKKDIQCNALGELNKCYENIEGIITNTINKHIEEVKIIDDDLPF